MSMSLPENTPLLRSGVGEREGIVDESRVSARTLCAGRGDATVRWRATVLAGVAVLVLAGLFVLSTTNRARARSGASASLCLFVTYHKTGHHLSFTLEKFLESKRACIRTGTSGVNGVEDGHAIPCEAQAVLAPRIDVVRQAPVTLEYLAESARDARSAGIVFAHDSELRDAWDKDHAKFFGSLRVVHFVRNPVDMIISGYLYHYGLSLLEPSTFEAQREHRILLTNPCTPDVDTSFAIAQEAGLAQSQLRRAVQLCQTLLGQDEHYAAAVRRLSTLDGLRLEAARVIVGGVLPVNEVRHVAFSRYTLTSPGGRQMTVSLLSVAFSFFLWFIR